MAPANEVNVRELRRLNESGHVQGNNSASGTSAALAKYAILGRLFADATGKNDSYYTDFFIDYLNAMTHRLGLPGLARYGLRTEDIPEIVYHSDCKNNPVPLSKEHMTEILLKRI